MLLLSSSINLRSPLGHTSVKSRSDFPKLCCFSCYAMLSICLCSCPIQHVPAESARSVGEIRRLELVLTASSLSIIARCWLEVQLVVLWRVRLLYRQFGFYRPITCPIQRSSSYASGEKLGFSHAMEVVCHANRGAAFPPFAPMSFVFCYCSLQLIFNKYSRNCDIKWLFNTGQDNRNGSMGLSKGWTQQLNRGQKYRN